MVRLQTEMAVIGAVYDELCHGDAAEADKEELYVLLTKEKVLRYSRDLEDRSGYAIINGFSAQSLKSFFDDNQYLFQYDPYASALNEQPAPIYRLRVENLSPPVPVPDQKGALSLALIRKMVEFLDPVINYPFNLLKQMGMLDVLLTEEQPAEE